MMREKIESTGAVFVSCDDYYTGLIHISEISHGFVKNINDFVKIGDEVKILKDNNHIEEVANHLETISYEVLCSISKRVPRIYKS